MSAKDLDIAGETFKKEMENLERLSTSLNLDAKDFIAQAHKMGEILNREKIQEKIDEALGKIDELEDRLLVVEGQEEIARNTIADVLEDFMMNPNGKTNDKITRLAEFIRDSQSDLSDKNKVLIRIY